jgi:hypothetical protein
MHTRDVPRTPRANDRRTVVVVVVNIVVTNALDCDGDTVTSRDITSHHGAVDGD